MMVVPMKVARLQILFAAKDERFTVIHKKNEGWPETMG